MKLRFVNSGLNRIPRIQFRPEAVLELLDLGLRPRVVRLGEERPLGVEVASAGGLQLGDGHPRQRGHELVGGNGTLLDGLGVYGFRLNHG